MFDSLKKKILQAEKPIYQGSMDKGRFEARKVHHYGISGATCMDYDPIQQLLAVGTDTGAVKIFGSQNSELLLTGRSNEPIQFLKWNVNQGSLITISTDSAFQIWGIEEKAALCHFRLSVNVTAVELPMDSRFLFIGTQSGDVIVVNLEKLSLSLYNIPLEDSMSGTRLVKEPLKKEDENGNRRVAVVALSTLAGDPSMMLIAFRAGVVVQWNLKMQKVECSFDCAKTIQSLCVHPNCKNFAVGCPDGSIILWALKTPKKPLNALTLWDEQVRSMNWFAHKDGDTPILSIVLGASQQQDGQLVHIESPLDSKPATNVIHTGPIVQTTFTFPSPWKQQMNKPTSVIILESESRFTVLDMTKRGQLTSLMPCTSLRMAESPILWSRVFPRAPIDLFNDLETAEISSTRSVEDESTQWHIYGGEYQAEALSMRNSFRLIVTAHENGTVRFWDASMAAMRHIHTLDALATLQVHSIDNESHQTTNSNSTPSSSSSSSASASADPRITAIKFCVKSRVLAIGWSTGTTLVFEFSSMPAEFQDLAVLESGDIVDLCQTDKEPLDINPGFALKARTFQLDAPVLHLELAAKFNRVCIGSQSGQLLILDYHLQSSNKSNKVLVLQTDMNNDVSCVTDKMKTKRQTMEQELGHPIPGVTCLLCGCVPSFASGEAKDKKKRIESMETEIASLFASDAFGNIKQYNLQTGKLIKLIANVHQVDQVQVMMLTGEYGQVNGDYGLTKTWSDFDFDDIEQKDEINIESTTKDDKKQGDEEDDEPDRVFLIAAMSRRIDVFSCLGTRAESNNSIGGLQDASVISDGLENGLCVMDEFGNLAVLTMMDLQPVWDFALKGLRPFIGANAHLVKDGPGFLDDGTALMVSTTGEIAVTQFVSPDDFSEGSNAMFPGVITMGSNDGARFYLDEIPHPARPASSFFKSMFGMDPSETAAEDYQELFGEVIEQRQASSSTEKGKGSHAESLQQGGNGGETSYETSALHLKVQEALQKLNERGERISMLEEQTNELENEAMDFSNAVDELLRQQESKKWWQL